MRIFMVLVAVSACAVGLRASAAPQDFRQCDGYSAPTKKGDGITTDTLLWGLAKTSADMRPNENQVLGIDGAEACDRALAEPLLKPEFATRRIDLMQAKAAHLIGAEKYSEALALLEEVQTVPSPAIPAELRDRGLGLANRFLRAFALVERGDHEAALGEIETIEAIRPNSPSVLEVAGFLRTRLDRDFTRRIVRARRNVPLMPRFAFAGLLDAIRTGRIDEAIEFVEGLTFAIPRNRGGWKTSGGFDEYDLIVMRSEIGGIAAYLLAAKGREEESQARIAYERAQIEEAITPPPPPAEGREWKRSVKADYDRRIVEGAKASATIDRYEEVIALRGRASTMTPDTLGPEIQKFPRGSLPVIYDLFAQLPPRSPEDRIAKDEFLAGFRSEAESLIIKEDLEFGLDKLMKELPRPETSSNQPRFKRAGDGYFLSDNGFSSKRMDEGDEHWTIRFTNAVATPATIEEFSLLSAAQLARKQGYGHFIIESRRTFERNTTMTGAYGGSRNTMNSGREAQLTIWLVRPDELPVFLRGAEWRILEAGQVIDAVTAAHPDISISQ